MKLLAIVAGYRSMYRSEIFNSKPWNEATLYRDVEGRLKGKRQMYQSEINTLLPISNSVWLTIEYCKYLERTRRVKVISTSLTL